MLFEDFKPDKNEITIFDFSYICSFLHVSYK
jgi:hypothetical protein